MCSGLEDTNGHNAQTDLCPSNLAPKQQQHSPLLSFVAILACADRDFHTKISVPSTSIKPYLKACLVQMLNYKAYILYDLSKTPTPEKKICNLGENPKQKESKWLIVLIQLVSVGTELGTAMWTPSPAQTRGYANSCDWCCIKCAWTYLMETINEAINYQSTTWLTTARCFGRLITQLITGLTQVITGARMARGLFGAAFKWTWSKDDATMDPWLQNGKISIDVCSNTFFCVFILLALF